jgi:acetyl-CoA synthetase
MPMAKQLSLEQVVTCDLENNIATEMLPQIEQWLSSLPASECWQRLTQNILKPDHPLALHQLLYKTVFSDWDTSQGPPPAWLPSDEQIQSTHIAALMNQLDINSYPNFMPGQHSIALSSGT